jgi:hypothetical protein
MVGVSIGGEAAGETEVRFPAGDEIEHAGANQRASDLRHNVGHEERRGEAASSPQTHGHSRIEVSAGNRP